MPAAKSGSFRSSSGLSAVRWLVVAAASALGTSMKNEATIAEMLIDGLAYLSTEGFELSTCRESSSVASGRIWYVEYTARASRRAVSVTFFADRHRAVASIRDLDDEFAFGDGGGRDVRHPVFADAPPQGIANLANYLSELRTELLTRHIDVLRGESFKNDAFDWSPYK